MSSSSLVGIDASRSYHEPMTGTERYSRRIVEHLLALDPCGMRYRLFFNNPPPDNAHTGPAEIRTIPARRLWTHLRLSRELRANPVDLLFVPSHVLPLYRPERSVVTIHDLGFLYEPDSHTPFSRWQLKLTTEWNASKATHVVAISESTKRDLLEHCEVDPGRITVIRHGIDNQFRPLRSEHVERYRRAARLPDRFVLYLGTIQPRKNLTRLITAFERAADEDPDLHLVLAGQPGWMSEPIRERARMSRFADRIRFLGRVPDEQLQLLYNAASALALNSLYEGFGLPALEAMACGVPVVLSNRGALPELAGADAMIVDPFDVDALAAAISELVTIRHDSEGVVHRVDHAERFSWRSSAEKTRDVLWNVLNQ